MATENSWGAPRIHGELLRLGFEVSERAASVVWGVAVKPGQTALTRIFASRSSFANVTVSALSFAAAQALAGVGNHVPF